MKIRRQQPIVICGPSGSGKSTLLRRLLKEFGELFIFTVSHTTRSPRKGELDGREYHFVNCDQMRQMIKQNEFIEYTNFSGNFYGTSKRAIRDALQMGRQLIIEVDIEGVRALSTIKELKPVFIFVKPPSKEALLERLSARGSESPENLKLRLERADQELAFADSAAVRFDLVLVNDRLDEAYARLRHFLAHILAEGAGVVTETPKPDAGLQKTNDCEPPKAGPASLLKGRQSQPHQIRVRL